MRKEEWAFEHINKSVRLTNKDARRAATGDSVYRLSAQHDIQTHSTRTSHTWTTKELSEKTNGLHGEGESE